jgi:DNA transformation protein
MQNDLLELKNLGNTSINWLRSIGINNLKELSDIGAVEAYLRIKLRDIKVSKVLLYALHGALTDTHWTELPPAVKTQLLKEADNHHSMDNVL